MGENRSTKVGWNIIKSTAILDVVLYCLKVFGLGRRYLKCLLLDIRLHVGLYRVK